MLVLSAVLFLIIALYNLRWATLILIALLPAYLLRFQIGPLPTTFLEVMIGVVVVVFLAKNIKILRLPRFAQALRMTDRLLLIFIALFLITATISIFVSTETQAALGIWKAYFIEPIILFFIFIQIFSKKDLPKIIYAIAISALLVSTLAIFQKFTGWNVPFEFWGKDGVFRVTSFYGFPNALGLYLAPIVPLLIFAIIKTLCRDALKRVSTKRTLTILFFIITTILALFAIIWAKSTGALIGLAAGALITALFFHRLRLPAILIIMIITSLFLLNIIPTQITQDLFLQDWSGQVRVKMWSETATMLTANWQNALFGIGLSAYPIAVAPFHIWDFVEIFQYPHNFILNFWSEIGLLGLLTFCALAFWFYKKTRYSAFLQFFLAWSMSTILIHGLVDVPYFKNDLAVFFWLLFGILILSTKQDKPIDETKKLC